MEIQEAQEADRKENRRAANVTVRVEKAEPGGKSWRDRLVVENEGPAPARDVRLEIDGRPVGEDARIRDGPSPGFPLEVGSPIHYRAKAGASHPKEAEVTWTWEDRREGRQSGRTRVRFT